MIAVDSKLARTRGVNAAVIPLPGRSSLSSAHCRGRFRESTPTKATNSRMPINPPELRNTQSSCCAEPAELPPTKDPHDDQASNRQEPLDEHQASIEVFRVRHLKVRRVVGAVFEAEGRVPASREAPPM